MSGGLGHLTCKSSRDGAEREPERGHAAALARSGSTRSNPRRTLPRGGARTRHQAGLLAWAFTESHAFPRQTRRSGRTEAFVFPYSGGAAPALHRSSLFTGKLLPRNDLSDLMDVRSGCDSRLPGRTREGEQASGTGSIRFLGAGVKRQFDRDGGSGDGGKERAGRPSTDLGREPCVLGVAWSGRRYRVVPGGIRNYGRFCGATRTFSRKPPMRCSSEFGYSATNGPFVRRTSPEF